MCVCMCVCVGGGGAGEGDSHPAHSEKVEGSVCVVCVVGRRGGGRGLKKLPKLNKKILKVAFGKIEHITDRK